MFLLIQNVSMMFYFWTNDDGCDENWNIYTHISLWAIAYDIFRNIRVSFSYFYYLIELHCELWFSCSNFKFSFFSFEYICYFLHHTCNSSSVYIWDMRWNWRCLLIYFMWIWAMICKKILLFIFLNHFNILTRNVNQLNVLNFSLFNIQAREKIP